MLYFYKLTQDYLKFEGSERLDLINRLSTNEVNSLEKLKGLKTILTSDKGRFVDLLTLYNFGDFIFTTCSFNNSKNVIAYLDKYTIMDDFRAVDMAGTHETILFYGDEAALYARNTFNADITNLNNNDFIFCNEGEHHSIIAKNDDPFGGFYFICAIEDKEFWEAKLFAVGNIIKVSDEQYELERIMRGIPAFGKEMSDLTNPLECAMNKYVSFTKGCYIGQEVIARLDAYDKISKHMIGLKTTQEINPSASDYKISVEGKECGFVTSLIKARGDETIGLGFIKTIFLDYNKEYKLKSNGVFTDCTVVKLPFTNNGNIN